MNKLFIAIICASLVMMSGLSYAANSADADAISGSNAGAYIDDHSTNKSKINNRQIVNPGVVPMPMTNGFFTAPTPDSSFRQVKELIYFLTGDPNAVYVNLTEGACEALAKGGDVDSNIQILKSRLAVAKADQDGVKWITISMMTPIVQDGKLIRVDKADLRVAGFAVAEADDGDTDSFQVIGKIALKAIAAGLDHFQITAEGAHRKVEASGWGIGFYTSGAQVSDGGTVSGLIGGGTGYSSNEAGPEDRPWVQGNVGLGLVRNFDREAVEYSAPVTK